MTIVKEAPSAELDGEEERYEIIDGVRVEKTPTGLHSNILATYLAMMINSFTLPRRLGMAISEADHQFSEKNKRRPDVAYIRFGKLPAREALVEDPSAFEGAPDLAIEVNSPSNKAAKTEKKVHFYFSAGVQAVWVVYPTSSCI